MKVTNVYDLKEYVSAHDSCSPIRGYVVMTDEDGKTLFAKHNMIVENGRELIKDLVYDNMFYTTTYSTDEKKSRNVSFSAIKFGNNNAVTKPIDEALLGDVITIPGIKLSINAMTDRCIHILTEIKIEDSTTTAPIIISEAGLFFKEVITEEGSTEKVFEKLFSRVAFAPITINSNNVYNLNYYIYF